MFECTLKAIILCTNGTSSQIVYHALKDFIRIERVIMEEKQSSKHLVKRRIKKLGLIKTAGQVSFLIFNKFHSRFSRKRIQEIMEKHQLEEKPIPETAISHVKSVNAQETISLLQNLQPDVVIVNGTRIIRKSVLQCISAPFINTHMGITPKYRGVHGAYWAIVNNDAENCGVTVHFVDPGIDTGDILYQARIEVEKSDNYNTYPFLQIAAARPLMKQALLDIQNGTVNRQKSDLPSKLWHHPTIWGHFASTANRLF